MNPPAVVMMQILRRQRWLLCYDALLLAARVTAIFIVGNIAGDVAAVAAYAIVGAVFNVVLIVSMGWFAHHAPGTA